MQQKNAKEEDKNRLIKFYENHKILIVISIAILTCVALPLVINKALYLNIRTNDSSDGDWLGFWGSFLGGILGGLATLIGVKLSIKQMKDENKSREKVVIIPMKGIYQVTKREINKNIKNKNTNRRAYKIESFITSNEQDRYNLENDEEYEKLRTRLEPEIKLVNVSNKNAIDVSILWKKPNKDDLKVGDLRIEDNIYDSIEDVDEDTRFFNLPLIRNSQSNGEESIYLYSQIQSLICEILALIDSKPKDLTAKEITKEFISLGTLTIKSHNLIGDRDIDKFEMSMSIGSCAVGLLYTIDIWFKLIPKKDK